MASKDLVNELIEQIESQGWNFVLALIKSDPKNKDSDELEIFCNTGHDPLDKLLKILKDYKKTRDAKVIDKKKE